MLYNIYNYCSNAVYRGDPKITRKAGRKVRRQNLCASQLSASQSPFKHHRDCGNLTAGVWLNPAALPYLTTTMSSKTTKSQQPKLMLQSSKQASIFNFFLDCQTRVVHSVTETLLIQSGHIETKYTSVFTLSHTKRHLGLFPLTAEHVKAQKGDLWMNTCLQTALLNNSMASLHWR